MQWFHGSAEKGNLKILYQPKRKASEGGWVLFEKGDDASILLKRSARYEEVREEYDRIFNEPDSRFDKSFEELRGRQANNNRDMLYAGDRQGDGQNNRPIGSEGSANNSRRSGANLLESNSGKGITNTERSTGNGGALSDAKNSISDRGDVEAYESKQCLETAIAE